MVMLSRLIGFSLTDAGGRAAKLVDLAAPLFEADYPSVTHLVFAGDGARQSVLPWSAVRRVDWRARRFEVSDLAAREDASPEALQDAVLLRQDVLDALVIDLQNRRTTRANDLRLDEQDGRLLLRAADTSFRALLRRVSRGLFASAPDELLYDWKYVEFLRGDPRAAKGAAGYSMRIARLPPGEIARLTDPLPYLHAAELLTLLPDAKAADVFEALAPERQLQVFEELEEDRALRLLGATAPDVAADLVGRLHTGAAKRFLERLPRREAERIIELLRYPEDTVGGVMTNDVVSARAGLTVKEARESLRERLKEPEFVYLIYVVDDEENRRLRGMLALRNLLTAGDGELLEEIMDPYVTTLGPLEPAAEAAYRVINSHLAGMPVVGDGGRLLGVVTVDAAVKLVAPGGWGEQAPRIFS